LSKKIKKNRQIFATQDLLWQEIQNQWQKLGLEISTIQSLADSMPDRYQEVIENNGSATHY
jgi:DNA-binding transcriptional MerR regulator